MIFDFDSLYIDGSEIIKLATSDEYVIWEKKHNSGNTIVIYDSGRREYYNIQGELSENALDLNYAVEVIVGSDVTSIGEYALYGSQTLTAITVSEGCETIGREAFGYNTKLKSVIIPNGVTTIGRHVCSYCYELEYVELPDTLTDMGWGLFDDVPEKGTLVCSDEWYDNLSEADIQNLGNVYNWREKKPQPDVDWTDTGYTPGYVIKARYWVDESNIDLYSKEKYSNITIESIILDGVEVSTARTHTFDTLGYHTAIITIKGKNSSVIATNHTMSLFKNVTHLTDVVVNCDFTQIYSTFNGCTSLSSVTLGDNITELEYSFYGCTNLTSIGKKGSGASIELPDSVTSIKSNTFTHCSSLTSVTIPDSVTSIGIAAFSYCSDITSITIPNSVTSISGYAFDSCSSLSSITIPNSVTSIGNNAFCNCENLTDIYFERQLPPTIGNNLFDETSDNSNFTIHVQAISVNAYKTADNWSQYADYIVGDL